MSLAPPAQPQDARGGPELAAAHTSPRSTRRHVHSAGSASGSGADGAEGQLVMVSEAWPAPGIAQSAWFSEDGRVL